MPSRSTCYVCLVDGVSYDLQKKKLRDDYFRKMHIGKRLECCGYLNGTFNLNATAESVRETIPGTNVDDVSRFI